MSNIMMAEDSEYGRALTRFRIAALVAAAVLLAGMIFYHYVENLDWVDALYFCTITLATVGYGDIVPKTDAGKLFTVVYVLVGIGIIATFANLALKRAVAGYARRSEIHAVRRGENQRKKSR